MKYKNNHSIINYWSYKTDNINDLKYKLSEYYSKIDNVELVNLNLIEDIFKHNHWFYCNKTKEIYFMNIIIDNINSNSNHEIIKNILSELKTTNFNQLNIYLKKTNKKTYKSITDDYYIYDISNIVLEKQNINNITKPSINIRYERRDYLKRKKGNDKMISATSIRNYMLNDPIIDYFKESKIKSINDTPQKRRKVNEDIFFNYITNMGIEFEKEVINKIKQEFDVIRVVNNSLIFKEHYNKTIQLLNNKTPIIYQGVVYNDDDNSYGIPDLIIRSDYMNKIFKQEIINSEEIYYVIVDIKCVSIPFTANRINILNSDNIPANKGQLCIYTSALNKMLNTNVMKAYILGKDNKIGTIDYLGFDSKYLTKTKDAIKWIKTVRNESYNWELLPRPSKKELYPNMKNDKDYEYHTLKEELGKEIDEITMVWNCGIKNRNIAHSKGIFKWSDSRFNTKIMNMKDSKITKTINEILDINRQDEILIKPNRINYDKIKWEDKDDILNCYLDFETINQICEKEQIVFMIGLGYNKNGNWTYKSFVINKKDNNNELNILLEFKNYIEEILIQENKKQVKLFHWSNAEVNIYNNLKDKYKIIIDNIIFYDLYQVFVNEPIVIKGALNYSLKTIAKALYDNKLINTIWDNNICSNGLNAMIMANDLYNKNVKNIKTNKIMKGIIKYNEVDCRVLFDIHNLIKEI